MSAVYIFIGGGLGSLLRYGISVAGTSVFRSSFPVGTFISNILACALLAFIVLFFQSKQEEYTWVQPLLLTGFCGGFSTFSTFGFETVQLMNSGNLFYAVLNVILSLLVGIGLILLIQAKA